MTLEEILALWQKMQPLVENAPSALTEAQIRELAENPAFQKKLDAAAKYYQEIEKRQELLDRYVVPSGLDKLVRFIPYLLVEEKTAEDRERNEDLIDMLYSPEGRDALVEMAIRATLGGDLSVAYPTSEDDALDMAPKNPFAAELMVVALNLLDHPGITLDPLIREQLANNQAAMQEAQDTHAFAHFYGDGFACALADPPIPADAAVIMGNTPKLNIMGNKQAEMGSTLLFVSGFNSKNPLQKQQTLQALRNEGVIGPESMFYRTYDKDGQPIPFNQAVIDRSEGKTVTFAKMDEAEQVKMVNAMQHPLAQRAPSDVGPTTRDGLRNELREMYNLMDQNDRMFIRSSKQFRDLKKELKNAVNGKAELAEAEAKKLLRKCVKLTGDYIKKKKPGLDRESQYGKKRFDVMSQIHDRLTGKLGILACMSFTEKHLDPSAAEWKEKIEKVRKESREKELAAEAKQKENEKTESLVQEEEKEEKIVNEDSPVQGKAEQESIVNEEPHVQEEVELNQNDKEQAVVQDEVELNENEMQEPVFDVEPDAIVGSSDFIDVDINDDRGEIEGYTGILDEENKLGKEVDLNKDAAMPFTYDDEEITIDGGGATPAITALLNDDQLHQRIITENKSNLSRQCVKNLDLLRERAVNAYNVLMEKCPPNEGKGNSGPALSENESKLMIPLIEYGEAMHELTEGKLTEHNPESVWKKEDKYQAPLAYTLSEADLSEYDPGILASASVKQFFTRKQFAESVRNILEDPGKLAHICSNARLDRDAELAKSMNPKIITRTAATTMNLERLGLAKDGVQKGPQDGPSLNDSSVSI